MRTERSYLGLILLVALALALRLTWGLTRPADDAAIAALPDQAEYLALGRNLLHTGTLSFHDPRFDQDVYAYRTPGYPAFVALCGGSVRIVRTVQALIDTTTALAAFLLAKRLSEKNGDAAHFVPPAAAGLVAINPLLIYFSALLLSETLFTACLVWAMYCSTFRRRTWVAILLLVFGVMVRPSGLALAVLVPMAGRWANGDPLRTYPKRLLEVAVVGTVATLALLAVLFVWSERNQQRLGQRVWLTTNEGITRYDGFNPRADGSSQQKYVFQDVPRIRDMTELERNEVLSQVAAKYIAEHPARVGELALRKVLRTWSPIPLSEQFGSARYLIVGIAYTVPLFVLAALGLIRGPLSAPAKLLLLTPAFYFTLVHAFSVGSLRYRLPVEPALAILAAAGVSIVLTHKQPATSH